MSDKFIRIEIQGLRQIQQRMARLTRELAATPGSTLTSAVAMAILRIQRAWMIRAPVDTGRYKASIISRIERADGTTVRGVAGSNVEYAIFRPSVLAYRETIAKDLGPATRQMMGRLQRAGLT